MRFSNRPVARLGMALGAVVLGLAATGVASAEPTGATAPDGLTVALEFTKDTYKQTEAPTVRVTLTNTGDRTLTGIVATCDPNYNDIGLTGAGWGDLTGDGVTVEAHSTTVLQVTEAMPVRAFDHGYVTVDCVFGHEGVTGPENPRGFDRAAVPGRLVEVTGRVVSNNAGLAGVPVVLTSAYGCPTIGKTTTDQDGRFTFGRVQAGVYTAYALPAGYTFKGSANYRSVSAVYGEPAVADFWPWLGSMWPHTQPPKCLAILRRTR